MPRHRAIMLYECVKEGTTKRPANLFACFLLESKANVLHESYIRWMRRPLRSALGALFIILIPCLVWPAALIVLLAKWIVNRVQRGKRQGLVLGTAAIAAVGLLWFAVSL
jgi:hypothetical protein